MKCPPNDRSPATNKAVAGKIPTNKYKRVKLPRPQRAENHSEVNMDFFCLIRNYILGHHINSDSRSTYRTGRHLL